MTFALLLITGLTGAAAYVTWWNCRNAPMGYEDESGFHAIRCLDCVNLKNVGGSIQCVLGYTVRSTFLTGPQPVDACSATTVSDLVTPVP